MTLKDNPSKDVDIFSLKDEKLLESLPSENIVQETKEAVLKRLRREVFSLKAEIYRIEKTIREINRGNK